MNSALLVALIRRSRWARVKYETAPRVAWNLRLDVIAQRLHERGIREASEG